MRLRKAMLPALNDRRDLPAGIHSADWDELDYRFGRSSDARVRSITKLRLIYDLAARTGALLRFIVFGSFVSAIREPRDIDVVLVMDKGFKVETAPRECQTLFSHADADARYGASVFLDTRRHAAAVRTGTILRDLANQSRWKQAWHCGGQAMIKNAQELAVTRERVAKFEHLLETLRQNARQEEWPLLSSGYRLEIERMQGEILDYLVQRPLTDPGKAA